MKHLNTGHADLFVSALLHEKGTMLATISLHSAMPWKQNSSHKQYANAFTILIFVCSPYKIHIINAQCGGCV
jgi:hypothetical protein